MRSTGQLNGVQKNLLRVENTTLLRLGPSTEVFNTELILGQVHKRKAPHSAGLLRESQSKHYLVVTPLNSMSVRRFNWRPAAVLLVATGCNSPLPDALILLAGKPCEAM